MKMADSTQARTRLRMRRVPTGMWRLFQDNRTASLWSVRGLFGGFSGMMLPIDPEPRTTLARAAMRAVRKNTEGLTQYLPQHAPLCEDSKGHSQVICAGKRYPLILAPRREGFLLIGHLLTPALQFQGM